MRIRLADEDDLPAILEIANWAARHTTANFATEPETPAHWRAMFDATSRMHPWLVADEPESGESAVLGFSKASPWGGRCAYHWAAEVTVYVHPDHHRRGIGPALYGQLIETMQAQGYRSLLAGVTDPNPASVKLHERMGFHRAGVFRRVGWKFDQWLDVEYWQLLLDDEEESPSQPRPPRPLRPPHPLRPVADVWTDVR